MNRVPLVNQSNNGTIKKCKALTKRGTNCLNSSLPNCDTCRIHKNNILDKKGEENKFIPIKDLEVYDIGKLTMYLPNEIIKEIFNMLDIFDLSRLSRVNHSAYNFIGYNHMIKKSDIDDYKIFVTQYRAKPCLTLKSIAKTLGIPNPKGSELILFPKHIIDHVFIYLKVKNNSKVQYKKLQTSVNWRIDKIQNKEFYKNFIPIPQSNFQVLAGSDFSWQIESNYNYFKFIKKRLLLYQKENPLLEYI